MTAMNEACSSPDHVAITFTVPAFVLEPPPQATVANTATNEISRLRLNHTERIIHTPIDGWLTAPLPRSQSFYVASHFLVNPTS
jgi:hypothetical protein